jgi:hypothetical protein
MHLALYLKVSVVAASIVTFVCLGYGVLVAPGVFFRMCGGLLGITWPTKTEYYVMWVFCSYFVVAFLAGSLAGYYLRNGKNHT